METEITKDGAKARNQVCKFLGITFCQDTQLCLSTWESAGEEKPFKSQAVILQDWGKKKKQKLLRPDQARVSELSNAAYTQIPD